MLIQTEMQNRRSQLEASTAIFRGLSDLKWFLWVGSEYLDCGSAELSINFVLIRGHGSLFRDLYYWSVILPGESAED